MPFVDVMYITEININMEKGDAFFLNLMIIIEETFSNCEQIIRKDYRRKNNKQ